MGGEVRSTSCTCLVRHGRRRTQLGDHRRTWATESQLVSDIYIYIYTYVYIYIYTYVYIYIYISDTSCDSVAQVRRWSPSCVRRRPWRTKQVHEVDRTSPPTPRHSFVALSMPRSAQCPCKRKGGEEERRSLTSIQTNHTHLIRSGSSERSVGN